MKERTYNILAAICLLILYIPVLVSFWYELIPGYAGFAYLTVNFIAMISVIILRELLRRKGFFEDP